MGQGQRAGFPTCYRSVIVQFVQYKLNVQLVPSRRSKSLYRCTVTGCLVCSFQIEHAEHVEQGERTPPGAQSGGEGGATAYKKRQTFTCREPKYFRLVFLSAIQHYRYYYNYKRICIYIGIFPLVVMIMLRGITIY